MARRVFFHCNICTLKLFFFWDFKFRFVSFFQVMSFDRYLAVTKAFDSRKWMMSLRSPTSSYVISAVGWIFSALFCVQLYRYSTITPCGTCEYVFPDRGSQIPTEDPTYYLALLTYINTFDPNHDALNKTNALFNNSLAQRNFTENELLSQTKDSTFTCK